MQLKYAVLKVQENNCVSSNTDKKRKELTNFYTIGAARIMDFFIDTTLMWYSQIFHSFI